MSYYIDLQAIKSHLNLDQDFCEDDEYLQHLSEAAVIAVENHIDRPLADVATCDDELPESIKHAVLLIVAHWYLNRESVSFSQPHVVPHSYEYLLNQYIKY